MVTMSPLGRSSRNRTASSRMMLAKSTLLTYKHRKSLNFCCYNRRAMFKVLGLECALLSFSIFCILLYETVPSGAQQRILIITKQPSVMASYCCTKHNKFCLLTLLEGRQGNQKHMDWVSEPQKDTFILPRNSRA